MLRVAGLALLGMISAAVPAAANDRHPAESAASAARQGTTAPGAGPLVQERTTLLQLPPGLTTAQSPRPGPSLTGARRHGAAPSVALATLMPEPRHSGRWLALPWLATGKSGLRLPVTERLSFGVGYRHLEGEDLWHRHAEAGSVDYDSHDFMLRANWRF